MELLNKTPFAAERVIHQDRDGRDRLVVAVKQTWTLGATQAPAVADEQVPLQVADQFWGEPGESSTRYESDLAPEKRGSDVILIGHAYPPRGRATAVDVTLRAGPLYKTVRVFGERLWRRPLGRLRPSEAEPFERMPLVWERAFGGSDASPSHPKHHEWETRNPFGTGLLAKRTRLSTTDVPLPNLEDPRDLLGGARDRPQPACFGFVSRHAQPRLSFAGTYDARWSRNRAPLLPADFDPRYHNAAHPDLVTREPLQGGEAFEISNASREGTLRFALPRVKPKILQIAADESQTELEPVLDTVVLEPDASRFSVVWRASRDVYGTMFDPCLVQIESEL